MNTNTRYLHDNIVNYAKALVKTLPPKLEVCTFVCTGSEANDLALRMARTYTGRKDIICLHSAYHGHTTSLIEISPYKYEGKGGFDKVKTTYKVPAPDIYRGEHKGGNAGLEYAKDVVKAIEESQRNGTGIAAMIAESILGCAGQIP